MKNTQPTKFAALFFALALVAGSSFQGGAADASTNAPERAIVTRAKSIVLPEFKLDGVTLTKALHQLQIAAKQSDPTKGVNFMVMESATTTASPKITLALKQVTVNEAAEQIAKEAGVRVIDQDFAYVFAAKTDKP